MFTGIIESVGEVVEVISDKGNKHFGVKSPVSSELKVDQSLAHEGVCLTVTKVEDGIHWVTAIDETLKKSNLGTWQEGRRVNLERCMIANGRFDGHIVQGHVDTTAIVLSVEDQNGSWLFTFSITDTRLIVEKGSICINGTSLTCFDVTEDSFKVAIIPYTHEHTTFSDLVAGSMVNIEYDIVGKYVRKMVAN